MIPPLQPLRLRSIDRWLKDQPDPPEDLQARALELDDLMIENLEAKEDAVRERMMRDGRWGTGKGMLTFPAERLALWSETVAEYLPQLDEGERLDSPIKF